MAKVKYYYDPETLSYRKIETNSGQITKVVLLVSLGILIAMFTGFIVLSQFVKTPDHMAVENELANLKLNYEVLNKRLDDFDENFPEGKDGNGEGKDGNRVQGQRGGWPPRVSQLIAAYWQKKWGYVDKLCRRFYSSSWTIKFLVDQKLANPGQ